MWSLWLLQSFSRGFLLVLPCNVSKTKLAHVQLYCSSFQNRSFLFLPAMTSQWTAQLWWNLSSWDWLTAATWRSPSFCFLSLPMSWSCLEAFLSSASPSRITSFRPQCTTSSGFPFGNHLHLHIPPQHPVQLADREEDDFPAWLFPSDAVFLLLGDLHTFPHGSDVPGPLCCHLPPFALHSYHEQQILPAAHPELLGTEFFLDVSSHHYDCAVAILWSQCHEPLLLWCFPIVAAVLHRHRLHRRADVRHPHHHPPWHPDSNCCFLWMHYCHCLAYTIICRQEEGIFHLLSSPDSGDSVLQHLHLQVHPPSTARWAGLWQSSLLILLCADSDS